tara:strand:- start:717 stop:2909 length:2193 start_codon:yes stop_codon:yes gene_type:complete
MKKIILTAFIILFFLLVCSIFILSTIGFETDKFSKIISDKIIENNKNIAVKLDEIKFKFDIKNFDLFLETKNPKLIYKNIEIPIEYTKIYLNFTSIIKSNPKIDKINISSKEININQLKKIIIKIKPSSFNSLIINKVKNGNLITNVELYLNDNLEITNFIAKGEVKEMEGVINKNLSLKDTSFNFFADSSDVLIKNVKTRMNGLLIKKGNFQIKKDKEIKLISDFISEIRVDKRNNNNYLTFLKNVNFINEETNLNANLENFLNVTFDKTFKVINYTYTNKGKINELSFKINKPLKNSFLEKSVNNLYFKDTYLKARYASDKKNYIKAKGIYSIDNKNYQNYDFKNDFLKETSNINLNFEFFQKLTIDFINYKKDSDKIAKIFLNLITKKDSIYLKELKYLERKNLILIEKLKINKEDIISLKKIKVKTFDNEVLKNDFDLDFGKKIKIFGNKYDAKNLNKFLNQKSKKNNLKKISKEIDINLKNIDTPLSRKLKNFRLIGTIKKGKFIKISSKGDFGNNKFLDISMKNDKKNKKKYLEVYSDLPQPLLSEYSFFKGLSDGILTFSSIIEDDSSSSKLIIDDFKLVNAPGVVKLLSLADLGGLADLAEGDGLSFEKMEINMSNDKGFIKLNELYAVGPSISVLMEGYKEESGLTSLKGTLVPAKNLNKLLSKIPVIGNIIIPQEVGEGLFGISFKMKGMPGKIKTSINPIKTLTPRFITKALEKSKKSK